VIAQGNALGTKGNALGTKGNALGTKGNALGTKGNALGTKGNALGTKGNATNIDPRPQRIRSPKGAKFMPQSLAQILVHLVFSTKNRKPLLADDVRDDLHAYLGGIVENQKGMLLKAGSVADHIHLLIAHPRTCSPSQLVLEIQLATRQLWRFLFGK
jgi:hypothetical protein